MSWTDELGRLQSTGQRRGGQTEHLTLTVSHETIIEFFQNKQET